MSRLTHEKDRGSVLVEPLVSVIVPVFNGESTIRSTLDSVLAQTYGQLEVLVIDDGSKDGTAAIVESYEDARLALYRFENRGAHISRNRGIARARGKYVTFLDADDWWRADKIEKQLRQLRSHPRAGVVYSFTQYVDDRGVALHGGYEEHNEGDVLAELYVRFFLQSGSNALITREVIDRIGGFDESLDVCDDYDFYLRAAESFEFTLVPERQIFYRLRPGSLSAQAARMRRASRRVIDRLAARHPRKLRPLRAEALAVTDAYVLAKALKGESTWRDLPLILTCFFSLVRLGRPGWAMLYEKRGEALFCLRRISAWLPLPEYWRQLLRGPARRVPAGQRRV